MISIDLSRCALKKIHPDLAKFTLLKNLNLSHNQIETISDSMSIMTLNKLGASLTTLDLNDNFISKIPVEICGRMPHLENLDLSKNQLR